jgi:hypothetical protein
MGLWSSFAGFIDEALGTGGLISDVVVPIATTAMTTQANKNAANKVSQGYQDQAAAIREGNANAEARYDESKALSEPAVQRLKVTVAGNPYLLTDTQKASLDDTSRSTRRTLNSGGLRGAGRAQVAVMRGVETGVKNQFIDENRSSQDDAAARLSGEYFDATGNQAMLDTSSGRATGAAALGSADTKAKSELANVGARGQALGDISAFLTNSEKEEARKSRYGDRVREMTV